MPAPVNTPALRCGFVLTAALLLSACAGEATAPAPVSELGESIRHPAEEYREVVAGDTLYSIAWESGRDYRELAAWNNITAPFTIKPGRKLRLSPPHSETGRGAPGAYRTVAKGDTLRAIAREIGVTHKELAAWNNIPPPYTIRSGRKLRLSPPGNETAAREKPAAKKPGGPAKNSAAGNTVRAKKTAPVIGGWTWPTDGGVLEHYSSGGPNKGLDIGGRKGQPIQAAAPGTIVYQGSGLRGYGRLIIIKHNADFLSAYAHCDKIYVKEGNVIKRGQKIAEMGNSGTDRVKLHFEIRYRGAPVDPLDYLPKK